MFHSPVSELSSSGNCLAKSAGSDFLPNRHRENASASRAVRHQLWRFQDLGVAVVFMLRVHKKKRTANRGPFQQTCFYWSR
jgi:hypothetical protein